MNACLAFFLTQVMTNSIDGTAFVILYESLSLSKLLPYPILVVAAQLTAHRLMVNQAIKNVYDF
jgi:hypothetical protein